MLAARIASRRMCARSRSSKTTNAVTLSDAGLKAAIAETLSADTPFRDATVDTTVASSCAVHVEMSRSTVAEIVSTDRKLSVGESGGLGGLGG